MWLRRGVTAGLLLFSAENLTAQALHVVDPEGKPVAGAHAALLAPHLTKAPLSGMLPPLADGETDCPSRSSGSRSRLRSPVMAASIASRLPP